MTHKSGSVKMPFKYRAWYAEIYGNTEDTGGFYVILQKDKESSEGQLLFWDVTEEGAYKQLAESNIEVEWRGKT